MARIRTIKPKFWDDTKLSKLSRDVRLLYIGMWNFADDLGVISADPLYIKAKVFPLDQIQIHQFEKWLSDLVQPGFISLFSYNSEEFYYLPKFIKHQKIDKPNFEDVFIKKDELARILEDSTINRRSIDDQSTINRDYKGGDSKGKESIKKENKKVFIPPSLFEVISFFEENGYSKSVGEKAFKGYDVADWHDSKGNKVKNWKQKMINVWFKEENKEEKTSGKKEEKSSWDLRVEENIAQKKYYDELYGDEPVSQTRR